MTGAENGIKILVYGATGYMGKLFARYALNDGLKPVLAGRQSLVTGLADSMGLESRIFGLDEPEVITENLTDIKLLINLAGPFLHTSKPLIEACIKNKTHYIDIAGEYPEFAAAYEYNTQAEAAGIMLMPGSGFGVVPTDIAASLAKQALRDATHLKIAYVTQGGVSRGTLATVLKDINKTGVKLVEGNFRSTEPASKDFTFLHSGKTHQLTYNPWRGDLFTAQLSTGIKNISTYANFPGPVKSMMQGKLLWLRDFLLTFVIQRLPEGPSEKQLQSGKTITFARVKNSLGENKTVIIEEPEAYLFSVYTLLNITMEIMADNYKVGFQTPSFYGNGIIENIDGVKISVH